jgi:uncharacterized protein YndB with AHSA1/START domain
MQATALDLSRIIRAPREKVFAAWTDPEQLKRWWGPGPIVCPEAHVDLRAGGEYRLANREQDGSITWISGRFERVEVPTLLVYTWSVSGMAGPPSLVTVEFRPHPDGTELVLIHARFAEEAVRDMHLAGWTGCIDKLERLLSV